MSKKFRDRTQAAMLLVNKLTQLEIKNGIVLAIPRGGVPIGSIIARELHVSLELAMSKKIGHPLNNEFAVGSVTLNNIVLSSSAENLPESYISSEVNRLRESLRSKYKYFTGGREPCSLKGKDVIIVDDGLATGNTMLASIDDVRKQNSNSIIVAVPVSSVSAANKIRTRVDQFVCLETPIEFYAVGEFYEDFSEVSDQMVINLLTNSNTKFASL